MSATYKCNLCNKVLTKHVNSYHQIVWVSRKFYKSKHSWEASATMDIKFPNGSVDMCEDCVEDIKKEAIKEFKKRKMEYKE